MVGWILSSLSHGMYGQSVWLPRVLPEPSPTKASSPPQPALAHGSSESVGVVAKACTGDASKTTQEVLGSPLLFAPSMVILLAAAPPFFTLGCSAPSFARRSQVLIVRPCIQAPNHFQFSKFMKMNQSIEQIKKLMSSHSFVPLFSMYYAEITSSQYGFYVNRAKVR